MKSIVLIIIASAFACLTVVLSRRRHHPYLTGLSAVIVLILLFGAW
jgi:hypothetical protein